MLNVSNKNKLSLIKFEKLKTDQHLMSNKRVEKTFILAYNIFQLCHLK